MSRYAPAKAELEQALVGAERRRLIEEPKPEPERYAAITVMQPWAWLIANASAWPEHVQGKTIENRSQATSYRGPVLIHVSRKWERVGEQLVELRRLGLVGRGCPEPNVGVMRSQLGQVIAVGELVGCRRIRTADPHPSAIAGARGWELEDVELVQSFALGEVAGALVCAAGCSRAATAAEEGVEPSRDPLQECVAQRCPRGRRRFEGFVLPGEAQPGSSSVGRVVTHLRRHDASDCDAGKRRELTRTCSTDAARDEW